MRQMTCAATCIIQELFPLSAPSHLWKLNHPLSSHFWGISSQNKQIIWCLVFLHSLINNLNHLYSLQAYLTGTLTDRQVNEECLLQQMICENKVLTKVVGLWGDILIEPCLPWVAAAATWIPQWTLLVALVVAAADDWGWKAVCWWICEDSALMGWWSGSYKSSINSTDGERYFLKGWKQ